MTFQLHDQKRRKISSQRCKKEHINKLIFFCIARDLFVFIAGCITDLLIL